MAKIRLEALDRFPKRRGKLILVTAITPTTSGEGKTVNTISRTAPAACWRSASDCTCAITSS